MSNVQRFSMALAPYTDDYEMRPDPDGDYVRSEDYDALAARLADAKAETCKFRRWHEESKNHLKLSNERLAEVEAARNGYGEIIREQAARLAEAEALLREARETGEPCVLHEDTQVRIDAFLAPDSANARRCFKCGHAAHNGDCVNTAPDQPELTVDLPTAKGG